MNECVRLSTQPDLHQQIIVMCTYYPSPSYNESTLLSLIPASNAPAHLSIQAQYYISD